MVNSLILHLDLIMNSHFGQMKKLIYVWSALMVFLVDLMMVCLWDQHWESYLDLLMAMINMKYFAVIIVNYLVLHLELTMETHLGKMK